LRYAPIWFGADGRHSIVRERAGLEIENLGAPMDVTLVQALAAAGRLRSDIRRIVNGKNNGNAQSRRTTTNAAS